MNVQLVLLNKNGTTKTFDLPDKVVTIGRREECDFCIPLMVVSKRHCQLNCDGSSLKIHDLRSTNGTFVNGNPIGVSEVELKTGDKIEIGPVTFLVKINAQAPDADTPAPEITPDNGIDIDSLNQDDTVVE